MNRHDILELCDKALFALELMREQPQQYYSTREAVMTSCCSFLYMLEIDYDRFFLKHAGPIIGRNEFLLGRVEVEWATKVLEETIAMINHKKLDNRAE
jgi:hypothetical protein